MTVALYLVGFEVITTFFCARLTFGLLSFFSSSGYCIMKSFGGGTGTSRLKGFCVVEAIDD